MFGAFGPTYCECGPNADWFVQEWFGDCIYTTWESVSFWIGMSSVLFWIVAQLPQFISNWRNQTAEALSPWFLFQWLAGDSFNLLGCVLTGDQLATQTFTATYFILADCVIISQYIYYSMREKERLALEEEDQGSSSEAHEQIVECREPRKQSLAEFQKNLPKITILVPNDISEDLEVNHDVQHDAHQYHPITSVTGRSGASMISHATQSPRALHISRVDHTNKTSQNSPSTSITRSPDSRPKGAGHQQTPNAQYHAGTYVTGRSGASRITHVLHSPKAPHNPHVEHVDRASQTASLTSGACSPEIGLLPDIGPQGSDGQCQASSSSKRRVEAVLERPDRTIGEFQTVNERNQCLTQNRITAARDGKIPEIPLQQLFPTAYAMKRRLRRLVNQYGLESGPPSVPRLTIHHVKPLVQPLVQHEVNKEMGGTLKPNVGSALKKRPVKAAACLASLLTVKTSTNYFQKSGTTGPSHGVAFGSRRLLRDMQHPGPGISISTVSSTVKIGRKLLLICGEGDRPWLLKSFGNCLGWGSSGLYFGSRFSQIAMNYQRMSAEGLSLAMLSCAILANLCMGVSILMRTQSTEDLLNKAPWLLGSMGTVSLDIFILLQAKYLESRCSKSAQTLADERTYLLA